MLAFSMEGMKSTRRREVRRGARGCCCGATSGAASVLVMFWSMESVEAMTEAAEPRQQSVFKGVREFEQFSAGQNFIDVFEDFHEVQRETFQRFGADFLAMREQFNGLRNEAQSEERIFEFRH